MTHIEFIGPPGAGKSTIYQQVIKKSEYYAGVRQSAIERAIHKKGNKKQKLVYSISPSIIQAFFEQEFILPRLSRAAFDDFVQDFPDYLNILSTIIQKADYQPEKLYKSCRSAAERYQIGHRTLREGETLCLDESFAQRAVSILWRFSDHSFSLESYLRNTPTPDIVISVDAPIDTCINRQQDRGSITASKLERQKSPYEEQQMLSDICDSVVEELEKQTKVERIDNTGNIDTAVNTVLSATQKG